MDTMGRKTKGDEENRSVSFYRPKSNDYFFEKLIF